MPCSVAVLSAGHPDPRAGFSETSRGIFPSFLQHLLSPDFWPRVSLSGSRTRDVHADTRHQHPWPHPFNHCAVTNSTWNPRALGILSRRPQLWYCLDKGISRELPSSPWRNPPLLSWGGSGAMPDPPGMQEPWEKLTLECKEGKSRPALEGPSGCEPVPTHGSMLIFVSSFTTQMPKEPST